MWTELMLIIVCAHISQPAAIQGVRRVIRQAMQVPPTPYPMPKLPQSRTAQPDFALALMNAHPLDCPTSPTSRRLPLQDAHLVQILQDSGGQYDPRLMATDNNSAAQLPNLIPLYNHFESEKDDSQFDFHPEIDNTITKNQLLNDLTRWTIAQDQLTSFLTNDVPTTMAPTPAFVLNDSAYSSAINEDTKAQLERLNKEIESILSGETIQTSDLDSLASRLNITLSTRILRSVHLPRNAHYRKKRNADGSTSTVQYCRTRGNVTNDGFLHLCSVCAVTTELASDKFPRYLNELVCNGPDHTCFSVNGHPHGVCKQGFIYQRMLRRRPGGCKMMIHNGQSIIVDAWETYTQKIRSGCECFIDQRSLFAPYVKSPISIGR